MPTHDEGMRKIMIADARESMNQRTDTPAATPETDAALDMEVGTPDCEAVLNLARQLERQRDEVRRELADWKYRADRVIKERDRIGGLLGAANNALGHQASLLSERDRELAEAIMQRDLSRADYLRDRVRMSQVVSAEAALAVARRDVGAKQAQIDRLMLEYGPKEMTPEQYEEWKRHNGSGYLDAAIALTDKEQK